MIQLKSKGSIYQNWNSAKISLDMNSFASTFEFSFRGDIRDIKNYNLEMGNDCNISIYNTPLFSGKLEVYSFIKDEGNRIHTISGRSNSYPIIKSDAKVGEFNNISIANLLTTICNQFGINVVNKIGSEKIFKKFRIGYGENAGLLIENICKKSNCSFYLHNNTLILDKRGSGDTINIQEFDDPRYFKYIERCDHLLDTIKGLSQFSDDFNLYDSVTSEANTLSVRHLLDSFTEKSEISNRCNYLNGKLKNESSILKYSINDWKVPGKSNIWTLNHIINFKAKSAKIDKKFYLKGIDFILREGDYKETILYMEGI